jgi:sugar phosphate isomerase/epimerase
VASLQLAAATFGFLYRAPLSDALKSIAAAGYEAVELSAGPPHIDLSAHGSTERAELKRLLARAGLSCVATNPIELNAISANADLAAATLRQYRAALELSADVEAQAVVMVTGRRNPLIPMPEQDARAALSRHLEVLAPLAEKLGVTLALETVPYGFLESATELSTYVAELGVRNLGMTVDCANVFTAGYDPVVELQSSAAHLSVVHISDSWRDRWAHTQVNHGELDFAAIGSALRSIEFTGPSVYELVDGEDPEPRLRADWTALRSWGWSA